MLFFVNWKVDARRRSGIQSKFLEGGTSTKCQEMKEPTFLCKMADRKIKENEEKTQEKMALLAQHVTVTIYNINV